jgi:HSP20 family protein
MKKPLPLGYWEWDLSWDMDGCLEPLMDIKEYRDEIVVTSDLPNVEKDDIEIYASENTLEIKAKMKKVCCFDRWGTLQRCISFSSFNKVILLPSPVDAENIKTRFSKGILEMKLPKKSSWRRIRIE